MYVIVIQIHQVEFIRFHRKIHLIFSNHVPRCAVPRICSALPWLPRPPASSCPNPRRQMLLVGTSGHVWDILNLPNPMESAEPVETIEHGCKSHQIALGNIRCVFAVGIEFRCGIRFDRFFPPAGRFSALRKRRVEPQLRCWQCWHLEVVCRVQES